jgi:hypothetical protein
MRLARTGENRAHDADQPPVKLDAAAKKRIANISIVHAHQSPSGCRFTTRVRLRIMKRLAGFSAIAAAKAARARESPGFRRGTLKSRRYSGQ